MNRGGLVDDADGTPIIIGESDPGNGTAKPRKLLYKPPAGSTGIPSAAIGWDYRRHGEDWAGLGHCGENHAQQSPVDLHRYVDVGGQTKSILWFDYYVDPGLQPTTSARLKNDGHGLLYEVVGNQIDLGYVKVGAKEYTAAEYVLHAPSEHTMDGASFPLELQVYNRAEDGSVVAVSFLFREGPSSPLLGALELATNGVAPTWTVRKGLGLAPISGNITAAFDLASLLPQGGAAHERSFFSYRGSLTRPPCTPGVDWWVLSTPLPASRSEIRFVRRAVFGSRSSRHGNARASMPLGNRTVSAGLVGVQHAVKDRTVPAWAALDEAVRPRGYVPGAPPWNDDRDRSEDATGPAEAEPT